MIQNIKNNSLHSIQDVFKVLVRAGLMHENISKKIVHVCVWGEGAIWDNTFINVALHTQS